MRHRMTEGRWDVRISFVVYALGYVMIELIGARLEQIGWPSLTPLDVATAVVHALFAVSVCVAVLLGLDVAARRWRRARLVFLLEQARRAEATEPETVPVESWRPEPLALPAGPTPVTFVGPDYATPDDGGALPLYVPSEILDRDGRRL
jgi:hypothetical protein